MTTMLDRYGKDGLVIVAINLDKTREAADAFLQSEPAEFTVAFDPSGHTAEAFHVNAMPSSFIVDRKGQIVYSHEGFQTSKANDVEARVKEALKQ